jgi:hypothetical protein
MLGNGRAAERFSVERGLHGGADHGGKGKPRTIERPDPGHVSEHQNAGDVTDEAERIVELIALHQIPNPFAEGHAQPDRERRAPYRQENCPAGKE